MVRRRKMRPGSGGAGSTHEKATDRVLTREENKIGRRNKEKEEGGSKRNFEARL